jgi:hypothetical protein
MALCSLYAKAQIKVSHAINSTGGSYAQGYYSFEWSVGEMAVVNTMGTYGSLMVTNGLLQPTFMIANSSSTFSEEEIKVLPNPTYNLLEVNILTQQAGILHMNVYDAMGKQVLSTRRTSFGIGNIEKINLFPFAAGTYFLHIQLVPFPGSQKKSGTFKIIKL